MKFPYVVQGSSPALLRIFPDSQILRKPLLKIVVKHGERKQKLLALVDSGADACLFPKDVADLLGIRIREGQPAEFTGIGGGRVVFYFHEVEILFDRYRVKTNVGFAASGIGAGGLLGQRGFFDQFVVSFDYGGNAMDITKPGFLRYLASRIP